jgi:hypothetical protein
MPKIYEGQKTAAGYSFVIPSGLSTFAGINFLTLKIKKPAGTIITKSLDISNLVPETKSIKLTLTSTETDEIGIFDYQVINTTGGAMQIGPIKQFYIRDNAY